MQRAQSATYIHCLSVHVARVRLHVDSSDSKPWPLSKDWGAVQGCRVRHQSTAGTTQ